MTNPQQTVAIARVGTPTSAIGGMTRLLTIDTPTDTLNGNLMIAFISYYSVVSITPPSGWSLISSNTIASQSNTTAIYYNQLASSPNASYTWSFSGNSASSGGIVTYSGATPGNPVDALSTYISPTNTATDCTSTSITTSVSGAYLLTLYSFSSYRNASMTLPAGITPGWNISYGSGDHYSTVMGDKPLGTSGATGTQTATSSVTGGYIAYQIAIHP